MGFADFLSSALTVGTQAAGAQQAGLAQRGQRETQDLLQRIQLARQQNEDVLNQRLKGAQIKNYESLAADRNTPPDETFGAPVPMTINGEPGMFERGNRGTLRRVPGAVPYEPPPAPPRTTTTTTQTKTLRVEPHKKPSGFGFNPNDNAPPPSTGPAFPRPKDWSDEKWNQYLKDTGQVP